MSDSVKKFLRDLVVTVIGASIAVVFSLRLNAWWESKTAKEIVCRIVANAYNEAHYNIDLLNEIYEKRASFDAESLKWQMSTNFIEELYKNVSVYKYLEPKYTILEIPSIYKAYVGLIADLLHARPSDREILINIEYLQQFKSSFHRMGNSIMSDNKWKDYAVPWTETARQILGRHKKKK